MRSKVKNKIKIPNSIWYCLNHNEIRKKFYFKQHADKKKCIKSKHQNQTIIKSIFILRRIWDLVGEIAIVRIWPIWIVKWSKLLRGWTRLNQSDIHTTTAFGHLLYPYDFFEDLECSPCTLIGHMPCAIADWRWQWDFSLTILQVIIYVTSSLFTLISCLELHLLILIFIFIFSHLTIFSHNPTP